jgi:hypothetical protein
VSHTHDESISESQGDAIGMSHSGPEASGVTRNESFCLFWLACEARQRAVRGKGLKNDDRHQRKKSIASRQLTVTDLTEFLYKE